MQKIDINAERVNYCASLLPLGTVLDVGSGAYPLLCADATVDIDGRAGIKGSITALPFGDKSFDAVTALEILEHLDEDDLKRAAGELRRVARMSIIVSVPDNDRELLGGHRQRFTARRLRGLFPGYGCRISYFDKRPSLNFRGRVVNRIKYALGLRQGYRRWLVGIFETEAKGG